MNLPSSSGVVDRQSYDVLLAEVARLQAGLEELRLDVDSLSACREACGQRGDVSQTVRGLESEASQPDWN